MELRNLLIIVALALYALAMAGIREVNNDQALQVIDHPAGRVVRCRFCAVVRNIIPVPVPDEVSSGSEEPATEESSAPVVAVSGAGCKVTPVADANARFHWSTSIWSSDMLASTPCSGSGADSSSRKPMARLPRSTRGSASPRCASTRSRRPRSAATARATRASEIALAATAILRRRRN